MDAKRWSPLWVFVGGCLTGAALIGFQSRGGPESSGRSWRADGDSESAPRALKAGSVEERVSVDAGAAEVVTRAPGGALAMQPPSQTTDRRAPAQTDTLERDKDEAGNSVADVLARLETEYRQKSAPARLPALPENHEPTREVANDPRPELARAPEPSAREASAPKLPASEQPAVVRAAAPPAAPDAALADARSAPLPADAKATLLAEEAARLALIREEQAKAFDRGQQQVAQMQELAALQQAALVEQYTLLQLQLLSLSPPARTPVSSSPPRPATAAKRTQRRAQGGRVIASLPSSISDTDNPWGFELQRSVLVR